MIRRAPIRRFDRSLVLADLKWRGRVEMAFDHAAVARPEGRGPRLTLLHSSRGLVPMGLAVNGDGFRRLAGATIRVEGRRVTIGTGSGAAECLFLVGNGRSLRLPEIGEHADVEALRSQLAGLSLPLRTRQLAGLDPAEGGRLEGVLLETACRRCRRVAGMLAAGERRPESYDRCVRGLAGLGQGLTPTGDDLLVGLAAAGYRFAQAGWVERPCLNSFLGCLAELDSSATTVVSAEMLGHAARGEFPEPLVEFVGRLGRARRGSIPEVEFRNLVMTGGSSGCDMLAGVSSLAQAILLGPHVSVCERGRAGGEL